MKNTATAKQRALAEIVSINADYAIIPAGRQPRQYEVLLPSGMDYHGERAFTAGSWEGVIAAIRKLKEERRVTTMTTKGIKCPVGHTTIWKVGTVPTRTGSKVRYKCSTCARSFYEQPKPKRVRKPKVEVSPTPAVKKVKKVKKVEKVEKVSLKPTDMAELTP